MCIWIKKSFNVQNWIHSVSVDLALQILFIHFTVQQMIHNLADIINMETLEGPLK